ncbi:MAG: hypothetical protein P8X82_17635 [Gemmatimonadales bacterium]
MGRVLAMNVMLLLGLGLVSNAAAQETEQIGDFFYVTSADPFDDDDRSMVATIEIGADEYMDDNAFLAWRCLPDGLNVIYGFNSYMGGDEEERVLVRYRFDRREATDFERWSMMQGNDAAWIPMHWVSQFTEQAKAGSKVVFRVTDPLDGETLTHEFNLAGLGQALTRLSCATY